MVKIDDRFFINATTNCYTLQEKTTIKDEKSKNFGQEIYKDLGYYTTIEQCLNGFLKVKTREFISKDTVNSIKDLKKEILKLQEFIQKLDLNI